jgi:hypothetical protein
MANLALLQALRDALQELAGAAGRWDTGGADWAKRSLGACDNATMKAILEDNRRGGDIHARASAGPPPKATSQQSEEPQDRSGWRDAVPLRSPDGLQHVDRLIDAQDRRDAIARAHEMGLSYAEWQRLSEKDIAARREQQEKKLRDKGQQK